MGGGGGGSRRFSAESLRSLTETAKSVLEQADIPRRCVFISFAMENIDHVRMLRGQAKNENAGFDFIDRSLHEPFNSERAEYIKQGIRERIRQSSVTLVYLSDATCQSEWVEWEIRESIRLGKGVIGVYQGDACPAVLPKALAEIGAKIVPWKHESIAEAIERASCDRRNEDE